MPACTGMPDPASQAREATPLEAAQAEDCKNVDGLREVEQQVKALATKAEDQSCIMGTHRVGADSLQKAILWPLRGRTMGKGKQSRDTGLER